MPAEILYLLIVVSAIGGFLVSLFVRVTKLRGETLFCPTDSDCNSVIHSRYSKIFWGIPNEDVGLVYYLMIGLAYAGLLLWGGVILSFNVVLMFISAVAFGVSVYLTYLQGAKLKEWCTLCLLSGIFCTIIFVAAVYLLVY